MKHELGDKVFITKHWRKQSRDNQLKNLGITSLCDYVRSDDMAGDVVKLKKYAKEPINETGYIVGLRDLKVNYTLMYVCEESDLMPDVDEIRQVGADYERIYLVATRMNCIRKVSFEDILQEEYK